jgi:hypothetical protein
LTTTVPATGDAETEGFGLGTGLLLGETLGDALGDGEVLGDTLGDGDALGETLGDGDALGETLGDGEVLGDALGDADVVGDADGTGVGLETTGRVTVTEPEIFGFSELNSGVHVPLALDVSRNAGVVPVEVVVWKGGLIVATPTQPPTYVILMPLASERV